MKSETRQTPPLDSAQLDASIRRAVEAAYRESARQIADLRGRLDAYARAERPDIVIANGISRFPAPRRGAMAFAISERTLYGADSNEWFAMGGGGGGPHTHDEYLTQAEGDALYAPLGSVGGVGPGAAGAGLLYNSGALDINTGPGIQIENDAVRLRADVAGDALTYSSNALHVVPGEALKIVSDAIQVDPLIAGQGLVYNSGVINVVAANTGAAGLTTEANAVRLTTSFNPLNEARVLATNDQGSLYLGADLLFVDNSNKRVGINREPLGAALDVLAANDADHTLRVRQRANQSGRLWRVEDYTGTKELIVLTSEGHLQSGNPGFVSGVRGWQVQNNGTAEFWNVWVRGELHASIFVMHEFHSLGGTFFIAPSGKLEADAPLSSDSDPSPVSVRTTSADGLGSDVAIRTTSTDGSGDFITARMVENWLDITDPPSGHAMVFSIGDRLRCKTMAMGVGLDVYDVWMQVDSIEDMTDYYRYRVQLIQGVYGELFGYPTLPAGAAVINYRKEGDGLIMLTSDWNHAPFQVVVISGARPWLEELTPVVQQGRLSGVGLPGIGGPDGKVDYGIVFGQDLSDANKPYFIGSNRVLKSYRIDSWWNDGVNDTAHIGADGSLRLGTNIGQEATTGLQFDPVTGNVQIGSPEYAGDVTIYGTVYLPDGAPIDRMRWRGTWVSGTAYVAQDAVYYNGSSWITLVAHTAAAGNAPGVGATWDLLAQEGDPGDPGANARLVKLSASSLVFSIDSGGIADPTSIVLLASGMNLAGSPSFAVTSGTATLTGTGASRTLAYTSMVTDAVTVTVTWDGLTDTLTVVKVRAGQNGDDGLPALTVVMSNEAHVMPATSGGAVTNFAGSGTSFQVWEGTTALNAAASGSGRFAVALTSELETNVRTTAWSDQDTVDIRTTSATGSGSVITARSLPLTPGAIAYRGTVALLADYSGMSTVIDSAVIQFTLTVVRTTGETVTLTRSQTLAKSKAGPEGPMGQDSANFSFLEEAEIDMLGKPAGLYMTADKVGYWDSDSFTSYIDKFGNYKFGNSGGASGIEYSAGLNRLHGVNGLGEEQWYVDGDDGVLYAGNKVALGEYGVNIKIEPGSLLADANRVSFIYNDDLMAGVGERASIGVRSYQSNTNFQLSLAARGLSGAAWGTIALRARRGDAAWPPETDDTAGANLVVSPPNVFIGPSQGLVLATPYSVSVGHSIESVVPAGALWGRTIKLEADAGGSAAIAVNGSGASIKVNGTEVSREGHNHNDLYPPINNPGFTGVARVNTYEIYHTNNIATALTNYMPKSGGQFTGTVTVDGALGMLANPTTSEINRFISIGLWKDSTQQPPTPPPNYCYLFLRKKDTVSGDVELVVIMPDGLTTPLAVQT